ncbi:MAG: hypothetical protein ACOZBL_05665 [Patescibacteria group bacterium]
MISDWKKLPIRFDISHQVKFIDNKKDHINRTSAIKNINNTNTIVKH